MSTPRIKQESKNIVKLGREEFRKQAKSIRNCIFSLVYQSGLNEFKTYNVINRPIKGRDDTKYEVETNHLTVWDMKDGKYKSFSLDKIIRIKTLGVIYCISR
jgi:hypothetical protein